MTVATEKTLEPLCVDLDGTIIKTDLLFESLARLARQKPWLLFLVPFWALRGRAYLKHRIAEEITLDAAFLPYNEAVLHWLRKEKAQGRELVLATAADESLSIADRSRPASTGTQANTGAM